MKRSEASFWSEWRYLPLTFLLCIASWQLGFELVRATQPNTIEVQGMAVEYQAICRVITVDENADTTATSERWGVGDENPTCAVAENEIVIDTRYRTVFHLWSEAFSGGEAELVAESSTRALQDLCPLGHRLLISLSITEVDSSSLLE